MKKNLQEKFKSGIRKTEDIQNKELSRKGKIYNRYKNENIDRLGKALIFHAPKALSIYSVDNHDSYSFEETIEFYFGLIKASRKSDCIIDFKITEVLTAAASLILFSLIHSNIPKSKFKLSLMNHTTPSVNSVLNHTGLKRLMRSKRHNYDIENVSVLPIISGVGNSHFKEIIDHIQKQIYKNQMDADTEYLIGDAVAETINNVSRHAYPSLEDEEKIWWLICEVTNGQLYLAIYDQGVGIPETVVKKKWFSNSLKKLYPVQYKELMDHASLKDQITSLVANSSLKDEQLIYMSMLGDVTGTEKSKHGQGSKSIRALVSDTEDGKLWVYSNNGLYKFAAGSDIPLLCRLPLKIEGTLIQWNIKVK
jgi:hypothetical protein